MQNRRRRNSSHRSPFSKIVEQLENKYLLTAPVAVDDSYLLDEDTSLIVNTPGVISNDFDPDLQAVIAYKYTDPTFGTVAFNNDGSFTYTPYPNYHGTDSFQYFVTDGAEFSGFATVNLTISPVNDAPVSVNDGYLATEDTPLVIGGAGVLGNDSDIDGDTLTALIVSNPTHGQLVFNGDGSFTYTPNPNYNGPDSFSYRAYDGTTLGNVATVSISVVTANDPPVAVNDSYTTDEDTPLTITAPGLLSNDSDVDGNPIVSLNAFQGPAHGTVTVNLDGSFTYTPGLNYHGPDSFGYFVTDGGLTSNIATVNITVAPVNDPPVATDVAYATFEDTPLNLLFPNLLANVSDVDGDPLTVFVVSNPSNGTLTLNPNGSFTYSPAANFHGTDTFTYRANDGTADSNLATVTIIVNSVNDAPVGGPDSYITDEDTPLVIAAPGVLANDTDIENDPLTADFYTQPAHGTVILNLDGSFTYTPAPNYHGPDSFTYQAFDANATSADVTVSITVNSVNDAPVAVDGTLTTAEDTPLVMAAPGVLGNDSDVDGDSLTALLVTGAAHGTVALNPDGSFTYTPSANYNGPDSFTYQVTDGVLTSGIATVNLTITAVNDAPVAVNDTYTTAEDTPLTIAAPGILANDSDVESDPLSVLIVSNPTHGQLIINGDGSFTYTPDANYNGPDSFTYRAFDGTSLGNVATVSINVAAVNDAPLTVADSYTIAENGVLSVAATGVLANDTDLEGDALAAVLVAGPAHGTLSLNADGSFTYTPTANYNGSDSFTYQANDGTTAGNTVTVSLTITPVNTPPVVTVVPPSATQWLLLDGVTVATFTDADADEYAGPYIATIDWGDGTPTTTGIVTRVGNQFQVAGSHIYTTAGQFTLQVTVDDPAGGTDTDTDVVTVAPIPQNFNLTGTVTSGNPGTAPNTWTDNSATPTIAGTAPPGYLVTVFGTRFGGNPVAVGQAIAGSDGIFQITTNSLVDGVYILTLSASNPGIQGIPITASVGTITIDTVPPTIIGLTVDPKTGRFLVTFQDVNSGMDLDTILNPNSYNVTRKIGLYSSRTDGRITEVQLVVSQNNTVTVAAIFKGGKRIRAGRFVVEISGQTVQDEAGNLLSGTFNGTFPTADDQPGSTFAARVTVKGGKASAAEAVAFAPPGNPRILRLAERQAQRSAKRDGRHR
ncbi:MAG: Ig-like domain-containing protein [Planctomycetota bacterium]